jgi:hypothetical protein
MPCQSISDYVIFEVLTAVMMKSDIFWNIKTKFRSHIKHIKSLLKRFEIFTVVTMKYAVFWDATQFGSYKN